MKSRNDLQKTSELIQTHGSLAAEFIRNGAIPSNQIGNLYGRHTGRQSAILAAMQRGASYSAAYKSSAGCFDTKRWAKVPARCSSCRGLLLKLICRLVASGLPVKWPAADVDEVKSLAMQLRLVAAALAREVAKCQVVGHGVKKTRTAKTRRPTEDLALASPKDAVACLRTALTKLTKNVRDVPLMLEKTDSSPTAADVAKTAVELGRIINGVPLLLSVLESPQLTVGTRATGVAALGREYEQWLSTIAADTSMVRIATHKQPDADAIVAAWLVDRCLFPGRTCQVEFVDRGFQPDSSGEFDAVVDVGRLHNPGERVFDHKPPAFEHRDQECAATLVWKHAVATGKPVGHLQELVEVVHDGDAASRRQKSAAYKQSRCNGLHAIIKAAWGYSQDDQMLYHGIAVHLNGLYEKGT